MIPGPSALQPVGFHPAELSALICQEVVEQHAEEAAFLWTQRDRFVVAPNINLPFLRRADERCEAHIDGLRIAGQAGWEAAMKIVDNGPGEVFAASVLAFESASPERRSAVLYAAQSDPRNTRALIAALGWMSSEQALPQAADLLESRNPEIRRMGLAAYAIHRSDPGPALAQSVIDEHERLATRAMKAAAELGKTGLLDSILSRFPLPEAAHAAARLGDRRKEILEVLRYHAASDSYFAAEALDMVLRCMDLEEANAWRATLTTRLKLRAAGILGDPAAVLELIDATEKPDLARLAGASISLLAGLDIAFENFEGDPPISDDDEAPSDPFANFQYPSTGKLRQWWQKREVDFQPGVRYLNGRPVTDEAGLFETLAGAYQPQRIAAARELALRHSSSPIFETRERAHLQLEKAARWTL
jgi:uncharacterized protein (TIGR02270 family)